MPIDLGKLRNVDRRPDGSVVAQCPACADEGADLTGQNHLIVYRDGRFGCVLYPASEDGPERRAHLSKIFQLVGSLDDQPVSSSWRRHVRSQFARLGKAGTQPKMRKSFT